MSRLVSQHTSQISNRWNVARRGNVEELLMVKQSNTANHSIIKETDEAASIKTRMQIFALFEDSGTRVPSCLRLLLFPPENLLRDTS